MSTSSVLVGVSVWSRLLQSGLKLCLHSSDITVLYSCKTSTQLTLAVLDNWSGQTDLKRRENATEARKHFFLCSPNEAKVIQ
ncbi:hypothetical protein RvY_02996-2 [Ramazzottius varieornatus]|uniref:Uncharacterized protein n=1 Tax=Ramazzottius varieornatus TaxID=947166 RepID=A0A1D1ULI8_RAMVA|nr:hypothetical protein RvY_02996-2 [Ramazzottius varieornatus]